MDFGRQIDFGRQTADFGRQTNFEKTCPKCNGAKRIKGSDGTIQTCWDCLSRGDMDQHSKDLKDSKIKV